MGMVAIGVFLHAVGGLAAGSFYLPFKKVRQWAWESYWLVGGVFSWLVAPWVVALLVVPDLFWVLGQAPAKSVFFSYLFGVLWGIGGLTFGLSMRYLGMSLGYAVALGFCAAFGTIVPPVFKGEFGDLLAATSGQVTLAGILVCLVGIAICGWAGVSKEKDLPEDKKKEVIKEFSLVKGLWVAAFAGIMSACMAFGIEAGEPIADAAFGAESTSIWKNTPVFIVVLAGGFTTNFIWCVLLNIKNRTAGDYVNRGGSPLPANYLFSALAGVTWYFQFMFYGMGKTRMGDYDFSSWTLHMAFIIIFSNLWGLLLHEWKGSSDHTLRLIRWGLLTLIASTLVVGFGNYLQKREMDAAASAAGQARVMRIVGLD
jgi:L-rhamnose-H+ transport protein